MKDGLLSIIIPFYNNAPYIAECIESILNQTYTKLELILVDDGSTDNGYQVCKNYADSDPRVRLVHKNNEGPILARYAGLKLARAEIIMFVDGDDWIAPDMCRMLMRRMMSDGVKLVISGLNRSHTADIVTPPQYLIDEGIYDKRDLEERVYPCMLWIKTKQCFGVDPSLCGKIFLKKMIIQEFEEVKGLRFHYGEDVAIIYPLLLRTDSVAVINRAYYYHRQRKKVEVPGYIKDDLYFDKVMVLYKYLKRRFIDHKLWEVLSIQLEYFYMYSVNLRKKCYQAGCVESNYLFPFDKVKKGSRIVLYGAGKVGKTYHQQLSQLDFCTIAAWVDKNSKDFTDSGYTILGIEELDKINYDFIVICNANSDVRQEIIKELTENDVKEDVII